MTERLSPQSVRLSQTGTDNDVDVLTLPANASVNVAQVAGSTADTAGTGRLEVGILPIVADPVDTSGTAVTIKYVSVNATADGDNTIIANVASRKIRLLGYVLSCTAAGTIVLQDTQTTPVVHGRIRAGADGGGASYSGGLSAPAFETAVGFGVEINNPTGVDTLGHMTYVEVA